MSQRSLGVYVAAVLFASASLVGCGGGGGASTGPKTYPVSGTVTQGGKPLDGATIQFVLADGKGGAAGKTDSNGRYTLSTAKPGDGAVAGQYKVAISKFEQPAAAAGGTSEKDYVPPKEGETAPAPKNLLPAKYASPNTSGLTATVKDSGENKIDFTVD